MQARTKRAKTDINAVSGHAAKLMIAFVLAPRFTLTAFAGFIDVLRLAADEGDRSRQIDCEWVVMGHPGRPVASSCGVLINPGAAMEDPARFDYIVVVGGLLHGGQKVLPGTYSFLRHAARSRVPLIGLCTGSFILARAGLLDGYESCVSWLHQEEFQREFPALNMQTQRMFIIDRDRLTCAGGTSVVHLAAHLVEKHCGRSQALKSLRILIQDEALPSNAWQPEAIVTHRARDSIVRQAMLMIEQNITVPDTLAELAQSLKISQRQIQRRFLSDIGITPRDYRLRLRLARARWMIEHTDRKVTEIALECGFSDCAHFSRSYRAHFQSQPTQLRRHPDTIHRRRA